MADIKPPANPAARKGWDKSEWEAKAKAKDEAFAEKAKEAEASMKQGKKPKFHEKDDLPKPTENMKQRTEDLGLNKNLNKTTLVSISTTGKGPRGGGFYCEVCNLTFKDSLSYLDHLNSRSHLREIGQTTSVARSTVSQVRARIAQLRAETANKVTAKNFDFQQRLKEVKDVEEAARQKRREERKRKREERREEAALGRIGVVKKAKTEGEGENDTKKRDRRNEKNDEKVIETAQREHDDMAAMMGFGGFTKRR